MMLQPRGESRHGWPILLVEDSHAEPPTAVRPPNHRLQPTAADAILSRRG